MNHANLLFEIGKELGIQARPLKLLHGLHDMKRQSDEKTHTSLPAADIS
jgi:hypothetical protein